MKNLRERDHLTEQNVSAYLDKYFYNHIINKDRIQNIDRIESKEEQLKGIDIIVKHKNGREFKIDEKVATNYNTGLHKFAFEIDSYQSESLVPGWLVNDNETEFYLLGWIEVIEELIKENIMLKTDEIIKEEDIIRMELVLVSKEVIKEYLADCGLNIESLQEIANDIRSGEIKLEKESYLYKNDYDDKKRNYHFTLSKFKSEQPLMINIRKEKLIELGNRRIFLVDRNGVTEKPV